MPFGPSVSNRPKIAWGRFEDPNLEARFAQLFAPGRSRTTAYMMLLLAGATTIGLPLDLVRLSGGSLTAALVLRALLAGGLLAVAVVLFRGVHWRNLPWVVSAAMSLALLLYAVLAYVYATATGRSDYLIVLSVAAAVICVGHPGPPQKAWVVMASAGLAITGLGIALGRSATDVLWDDVTLAGVTSAAFAVNAVLHSGARNAFFLNEQLLGAQQELRRVREAEAAAARRALRKRDEEWWAIVDNGQVVVALVDESGLLVFVNEFANRVGLAEGTPFAQYAVDGGDVAIEAALQAAFQRGESSDFDLVLPEGDASRTVAFRVTPVGETAPHERVGLVGLDITESRRMHEDLLHSQKMQAVGALVGGIAHDFNNLLTVITGCTELLRFEDSLGSLADQYVTDIADAAGNATKLTRQLLLFSRRTPSRASVADPCRLVGAMTSWLERLLGSNVELQVQLDPDAPSVRADPGHIEQVVMNLVVNARDAMPNGGRIRLSVVAHGDGVLLTVSDDGEGMSVDVRERIFDPFFSTKAPGRGTGLGLATVKGVVERMKGAIDVRSELGAGTTFEIWLPAAPASAHSPSSEVDVSAVARTVLVVDDSPEVLQLACAMLSRAGYDVVAAHDIASACREAGRCQNLDVVVTDVHLKHESGIQLVDALDELGLDVPVVYMSAFVDHPQLLADVEAGRAILVDKPFSSRELVRAIRRARRLFSPRPSNAAAG